MKSNGVGSLKYGIFFILLLTLVLAVTLSSCKPSQEENQIFSFPEIPAEARTAVGSGDPRSTGYWALWNTCATENRAEVAEANGGRAAGWYLMDDLLKDPGIQVGNLPVATCEQGLALLEGQTSSDLVFQLASQVLAAELNLSLGAESCTIVEEAVLGAHLILSDLGFDGKGEYAPGLSGEAIVSVNELIDYLTAYNIGELCVN